MNTFLFFCSLVGAGVLLYIGLVETGELRAGGPIGRGDTRVVRFTWIGGE